MIQRISAVAGWLSLVFIVYATLSPIDARPMLSVPHLERFAAFALTGIALASPIRTACCLLWPSSSGPRLAWRRFNF